MTELLRGFDAAMDVRRALPHAVKAECKWAGRYYSRHPAKNLSRDEALALASAGLSIVTVWEAAGDNPRMFTAEQGTADATDALKCAADVGQPEGSAIYFAVDFDASLVQIAAGIEPYFQAVNDVIGNKYRVGVYGSGSVCSRLLSSRLAMLAWLGGALGWAGSRAFPLWNIKQHPPGDPWGFGFQIDPDEASGDFGQFQVKVPAAPAVQDAVGGALAHLQQSLLTRGFYKGSPDGLYGPKTQAALEVWSQSRARQ